MVAPLKQRGLEELASLQNRVRRQYGLGRITREDFDYLETRLTEAEIRIVEMSEKNTKPKHPF